MNFDDFTDNGLWTPQTAMLQAIKARVGSSRHKPKTALSIDRNDYLDRILLDRWPKLEIQRALYPEVDVQDLSNYAPASLDLIYSHQVLEHVKKPWIAAAEMVRVLKKGGLGIHTTCAFNPRHGMPAFGDYYRFLPEGLVELFDGVKVLEKGEWGNKQALLYNVGIDDGHGELGGRRFCKAIGEPNDGLYPWHTWIIFEKS